jgi:hypothetical protein
MNSLLQSQENTNIEENQEAQQLHLEEQKLAIEERKIALELKKEELRRLRRENDQIEGVD